MNKARILLIAVSVILVVAIYSLPKVVVDNESESVSDPEIIEEQHTGSPRQIDGDKLREFNAALKSSKDNQKSAIFADSLARLFDGAGVLDSAAYYFELKSRFDPGSETDLAAGEAYYKAFSYSNDQEKANEYGRKAREFFEKVLEKEPENTEVKAKIAMTLVSSGTPMEGIMMLRSVLEEDPDNETALFNLGILSIQSGQYDRAVERFEKLISIDPDNIQAKYFLGVSYFETDRKEEAKRIFEDIKKVTSDETISASVDSYLDQLE